MALITWGPTLAVGLKDIDDQHQKLTVLINQLNDAMHAGKGKEVIGKVLSELVSYTQYHFATEEHLMATHEFGHSEAHKEEHRKLVKEVGAFRSKFESGNAFLSVEVMKFLRDWLTKHIMGSDKELARAINQGAKVPAKA